jgi:hypothetical protein
MAADRKVTGFLLAALPRSGKKRREAIKKFMPKLTETP